MSTRASFGGKLVGLHKVLSLVVTAVLIMPANLLSLQSVPTAQAIDFSLFNESFASTAVDVVGGWSDSDGAGEDARISIGTPFPGSPTTGHARLRKSASIAQTIDTTGYESITLNFDWKRDSDAEEADHLVVEWKPSADGAFLPLLDETLICTDDCDDVQSESFPLPGTADNTSIDIRFTGATSADTEEARIDDVLITAVPLEIQQIAIQVPVCGDAEIHQESEQCDDGNTEDGDGCSSQCTIEEIVPTFQCEEYTNDDIVACIGNTPSDEGCENFDFNDNQVIDLADVSEFLGLCPAEEKLTCDDYNYDAALACVGEPAEGECAQYDFNDNTAIDLVDVSELLEMCPLEEELTCDDYDYDEALACQNEDAVDECAKYDFVDDGTIGLNDISELLGMCPREETPQAYCGDRKIDDGEQCDDGNIFNGDGCNYLCQNEINQCDFPLLLDFDNLEKGTVVTDQYAAYGISFSAENNDANHPNKAVVFDTANPTGGDDDLGTPNSEYAGPGIGDGGLSNFIALFKSLIIGENDVDDSPADGLIDTPDDEATGGKLIVTFDEPVAVTYLDIIDIEEEGGTVKGYNAGDSEVFSKAIADEGDNSYQNVLVNQDEFDTSKLEVTLVASGAIDNLSVCLTHVCGDQSINGPEQCDDGNTENGDGCSASCQLEEGPMCEEIDENDQGWFGEYFNYPGVHPDMNIHESFWPDANHGDPLSDVNAWDTDWYDNDPYFRFSRVDSSLEFGGDFFPFDIAPEEIDHDHEFHFGVHWRGLVTVDAPGVYNASISSDDDAWIYVDGELVTDNAGIHQVATELVQMELTGSNVVDIYFAERHIFDSFFNFAFDDDISVTPLPPDCEPEGIMCEDLEYSEFSSCLNQLAEGECAKYDINENNAVDLADLGSILKECGDIDRDLICQDYYYEDFKGCMNKLVDDNPECALYDLNENNVVDLADLSQILQICRPAELTCDDYNLDTALACVGETAEGECAKYDFNENTAIDLADISELLNMCPADEELICDDYNTDDALACVGELAEDECAKYDFNENTVIDLVDVSELLSLCPLDQGPICGDEVVEEPEQCDDGNTESGDGCSAQCTIEEPTGETGTCSDQLDNESDELTDIDDPDCHTDGDAQNPDSYDPDLNEDTDDGEEEPTGGPVTTSSVSGGSPGSGGSAGLNIHTENLGQDSTTQVTITWFTNVQATSRVVYGTSSHDPITEVGPNYGYANSNTEDTSKTTFHSMVITGLTPETLYYFRPVSSDGSTTVRGIELTISLSEEPIVLGETFEGGVGGPEQEPSTGGGTPPAATGSTGGSVTGGSGQPEVLGLITDVQAQEEVDQPVDEEEGAVIETEPVPVAGVCQGLWIFPAISWLPFPWCTYWPVVLALIIAAIYYFITREKQDEQTPPPSGN